MIRQAAIILPLALLAACDRTSTADTAGTNTSNMMAANDMAMAPATMNAAAPAATADAAGYLAKAGAGDMFEIESSRAILAKTDEKAVNDFANMMIKAHTDSTAKLKAAAARDGVTVTPPALDDAQQAQLDKIRSATATAAVTTYIAGQREAHRAALALHQSYAASGTAPAIKAAAGEIVPVVQQHIDMLAEMPGA